MTERNKFENLDLKDIVSHGKIISIITAELQNPGIDRLQHATDLLNDLFQLLSLNFKDFLSGCRLTPAQKKRFISYLLYSLYYYEIPVGAFANIQKALEVENFLLVMAAESLEQKKVIAILQKFSLTRQLYLVNYCFLHVREGAWSLINLLASMHEDNIEWKLFIKHLRTKYYNVYFLNRMLPDYVSKQSITLSTVVEFLEKQTAEQILNISILLPKLIHSIIQSPLAFFELLKNNPQIDFEELKKNSQRAHENLKNMFLPYSNETYSLDELTDFFRNFGLNGHILDNSIVKNPIASLSLEHQLQILVVQFLKPWDIPEVENRQFILFALSLCQHLYSYHRMQPSPYIAGLHSLVFALSTRGNKLPNLPWLQSVLEGLDSIYEHLQAKGYPLSPLNNNPIVIFDQAATLNFKRNSAYISSQSLKYRIPILHLSKKQTLQLAKKLGIDSWIKTSSDSNFGYGGARNCALLLAPVIAAAFQQGTCNFEKLMLLDEKELKKLYDQAVLGKNNDDLFIHLGEDDVAIPICNIFSDALFAEFCEDLYFNRAIDCYGRTTHDMFAYLDLKNLLEQPSIPFFPWSNVLFRGSMKGMLTKPKFCLPVPFGNEEPHVMLPNATFIHFLQANIHLAGTRFPQKELPISPLDDILESLSQQLVYRFHISMSSVFTDSKNQYGGNIFIWNEDSIREKNRFQCLNDLWKFASSKSITQELKDRFWNNVEFAFREDNSNILFRRCLSDLIHVDLTVDAPQPLKEYYQTMKREAQLFDFFVKTLLTERRNKNVKYLQTAIDQTETKFGMKISSTRLAKGLLVLINVIENFGKKSLDAQKKSLSIMRDNS